jgi:hypothetical protein
MKKTWFITVSSWGLGRDRGDDGGGSWYAWGGVVEFGDEVVDVDEPDEDDWGWKAGDELHRLGEYLADEG